MSKYDLYPYSMLEAACLRIFFKLIANQKYSAQDLFVECRRRLFHPGKVINKWHDCLRITCGEEPRVNALVERQVCVHGLCVIN